MNKRETIAAVLGEDLVKLLLAINVYDTLLEGKLYCSKCNSKLDENNLMVIVPKSKNNFEFVCNDSGCYESFAEQKENA